jgi:hypothetical protein
MVDKHSPSKCRKAFNFYLLLNLRINGFAKDQNLERSYVALDIALRCLQLKLQEYLYSLFNSICLTSIPLVVSIDYRVCQNIKNYFQYFFFIIVV